MTFFTRLWTFLTFIQSHGSANSSGTFYFSGRNQVSVIPYPEVQVACLHDCKAGFWMNISALIVTPAVINSNISSSPSHDERSRTPSIVAACNNNMSSCMSGSDDLSAKLWDVRTGQCIYGIQTHTCATVKFDEQKLVTGSFDNTIACWEWSTGAKIQQFRGHTGAGWLKSLAFIATGRTVSV